MRVTRAISQMLGRARLRIWILAAIALGIGAGWVPLFGTLGYELAVVTAGFAAVASLDLGAALSRELAGEPHCVSRGALGAALLAAAVAAIPGVLCAIRGTWVVTCDWWFGLVAYASLPLATAALGGALGFSIGATVGVRDHERRLPHRSTVLALLVVPLLAFAGLYRFYAAPPVFTYDALIGYFPGNLYDENVQLGATLAWARLEQLAWVVAIVCAVAARPGGPRRAKLLVGAAALAGALTLHAFGGTLGYAVDTADLDRVLDGRVETAHFVIHYARTPEIERDMPMIAVDHELRYAQVVAQLGDAPAGKLTSYYFANGEQKARWMGARDVEMAKPWRHEIYLDHRAWPHPALRHEIAHAVASAFGDPIFGVAARRVLGIPMFISPGLIEGLAVAIDWPGGYDRLTPHEAVRAMAVMGLEPALGDLFSLKFFELSSARGYTTAGSFLRFLLDHHGAAKLRAVYGSGGDFEAAYGMPLVALEAEWKQMIAAITLPADAIEGSRERFRGGGVLSRPCPHAIAARREQAEHAYDTGDRPRAIALSRHVCGEAPDEPRYQLTLGDYLVGGTPLEHAEALGIYLALAEDAEHVTSSVRADAYERLARISSTDDLALTTALIERARTLPIDGTARRQLDGEAIALHYAGPAGPALRGYFFPPLGDHRPAPEWARDATHAEPTLGFGYYLLGLQAYIAGDWPEAAADLDRSITAGLPGSPFVRNAARRLAIAAYRVHDAAAVSRAIAALSAPEMTTVDHLYAEDFRQRLAFDRAGAL